MEGAVESVVEGAGVVLEEVAGLGLDGDGGAGGGVGGIGGIVGDLGEVQGD